MVGCNASCGKTPFLENLEKLHPVMTLSSFIKCYSDMIRLIIGSFRHMTQEVMASVLVGESTTNNDQSTLRYSAAMKGKMDFILRCNRSEIDIDINTAANIYQECIDDVVNGIRDLCMKHQII